MTYIDDPLFQSHYTDWFDGIQFRFDNGPYKESNDLALVEIKDINYYEEDLIAFTDTDPPKPYIVKTLDEDLTDYMSIKMKYNDGQNLMKRPMYRYRIEFHSSDNLSTTGLYGTGRKCDQYANYPSNSHTFLTFTVTNITTGLDVVVSHSDNGV